MGNNANSGNLPMNGNQTGAGGRRNNTNRRNNTRNNSRNNKRNNTKRRVQGGTLSRNNRHNNRHNNMRKNTKRRVQGGTLHNRSNKHNQNTMHYRNGNGGSSALATAALPFGLFGLQKLAQKRKARKLSKNA